MARVTKKQLLEAKEKIDKLNKKAYDLSDFIEEECWHPKSHRRRRSINSSRDDYGIYDANPEYSYYIHCELCDTIITPIKHTRRVPLDIGPTVKESMWEELEKEI